MSTGVHKSTVFFMLALLVMVAVAGLSYWSNRHITHAISEWENAIQNMRSISTLRSALQDAETGQRGFLLTGNEEYLVPYRDALTRVQAACDQLLAGTDSDLEQQLARDAIRLAREEMAELDRTVKLFRTGDATGALALVRSGKGKQLMDQFRNITEVMYRTEREHWRHSDKAVTNASRYHKATIISGNLLAVILVAIAFRVSHKERLRREAYEAGLVAARRDAEAANRAKAAFLANMTHELRTPLNAIIGFSEVLAKGMIGPPLADRQQELVTDIMDSGRSLLGLINDILYLSSVEAGETTLQPRPLNLPDMLDRVMLLLKQKASKKGIDLKLDPETEDLQVLADEQALLQILVNVVGNAVKFTHEGGWVSISALPIDRESISIRVMDNGPGIPQQVQTQLFRLFEQGDRSLAQPHGGTGMGLYLSRSLVTRQQGNLWLESEPGVGTTVIIELPAPPEGPDIEKGDIHHR